MTQKFKVFLVDKTEDNQFHTSIVEQNFDNLPPGEVLIQVAYSSLNYKDALSATGHPGVTQKFPHVPGIDAAGTVVKSSNSQYKKDDLVIVTGYDLGMNTWGGFAEYIRVPAEWVVPLPNGLTLEESMILGTAGLTAGLCINALIENSISPALGEIIVTGATGGVGSLAVSILSQLAYQVVAATGKTESHQWLKQLGATTIIDRFLTDNHQRKPLLPERWAGAVDTVGGNTLATILKSTQYNGCVAACGLVGGAELPTTVYPFILRGVSLIGIDSVQCSGLKRYGSRHAARTQIWAKLGKEWKPHDLAAISHTIGLEQLPEKIEGILNGKIQGRTVVNLQQ
jgi:putative YhdH/YhfP family quinone oxidoreductase